MLCPLEHSPPAPHTRATPLRHTQRARSLPHKHTHTHTCAYPRMFSNVCVSNGHIPSCSVSTPYSPLRVKIKQFVRTRAQTTVHYTHHWVLHRPPKPRETVSGFSFSTLHDKISWKLLKKVLSSSDIRTFIPSGMRDDDQGVLLTNRNQPNAGSFYLWLVSFCTLPATLAGKHPSLGGPVRF